MAVLPRHWMEAGHARFEERLALGIDRDALLRAHDEGAYPLGCQAALVWERVPVEQLHQPMELVRFALVRGCGQQKQVRRRLRESGTQFVTGDLIRAATH